MTRALLLCLLVLGPAAIQAQSLAERIYLRAGAGPSEWRADCTGTSACDRRDTAAQLGVGYEFDHGLAVEAAYAKLGRMELANDVIDVSVRSQGLLLGAAWQFDAGRSFTVSLRGGVAILEADQGVSSASGLTRDKSTREEPYVGISAGYRLAAKLELELAGLFTRLRLDERNPELGRGVIRMFTLGVRTRW